MVLHFNYYNISLKKNKKKESQTKPCFRGFDNDLQDKEQPNKPKLSTDKMLCHFLITSYWNKINGK